MQKLRDILDKIQSGELPISKIASESGISGEKMYKWKQRKKDLLEVISVSDAQKLMTWAGYMDNSPEELFSSVMLDPTREPNLKQISEALKALSLFVDKIDCSNKAQHPGEKGIENVQLLHFEIKKGKSAKKNRSGKE